MAGRIKAEDIALVKERAAIEELVREHGVNLRPAGAGSLKGLCPFHDERTPSFTVRPSVGAYHCFGCGEGGDAIAFVQKVDHLSFTEAVERLAARAGITLRYEEGGETRQGEGPGRRTRLIEANRVAEEFFAECLSDLSLHEARAGRDMLRAKGFSGADARRFGVGYAPRSGQALIAHLSGKGITPDEAVNAGLVGRGQRGFYDRFRGRLIWPIRDITGDTVGFGARRLYDDDRIAAKYLNTSETPVYKKTHVLYGLDLAKKAMARDRQAVIVEGYTDVMAAHLSGVEHAVATCGTAFGPEHIKRLRQILRDEPGQAPARVVFTFDGDAAGQKAAMKAFAEDQRWASQSFVAVAPGGQDPNDLRLSGGDEAVRALIEDAVPMFEFAVRTTIDRFDLAHPEGRVAAMRASAPIISAIRDRALRPEYTRTVAGWIGVEVEALARQVADAGRQRPPAEPAPSRAPAIGEEPPEAEPGAEENFLAPLPRPDLRDPVIGAERQLLQVVLQYPHAIPASTSPLAAGSFVAPAHALVFEAIQVAGGLDAARTMSAAGWVNAVLDAADPRVVHLISELRVASLPVRREAGGELPPAYISDLLVRIRAVELNRRISEAMSSLRRADPDDQDAARAQSLQLQAWQRELAELRSRG